MYLYKEYVMGFDCDFRLPVRDFIWNIKENYYAYVSNKTLVIQPMQETRQQKIFQE